MVDFIGLAFTISMISFAVFAWLVVLGGIRVTNKDRKDIWNWITLGIVWGVAVLFTGLAAISL